MTRSVLHPLAAGHTLDRGLISAAGDPATVAAAVAILGEDTCGPAVVHCQYRGDAHTDACTHSEHVLLCKREAVRRRTVSAKAHQTEQTACQRGGRCWFDDQTGPITAIITTIQHLTRNPGPDFKNWLLFRDPPSFLVEKD